MMSWTMINWAFAIATVVLMLIVLAVVFGRETLKDWVAAIWQKRTGGQP
jgi:hypothetical protein